MSFKFLFRCCILYIFVLFNFSCQHTQKDAKDIELSGRNKEELSHVIRHFSENPKDSLKLKAAYFLIRNMKSYYSYGGKDADKISEIYRLISDDPDELRSAFYAKYIDSLKVNFNFIKHFDINDITAEYLIENINEAFKSWETHPWGKDYNFEIFCEYVLPYRIDNEKLTSWRKFISTKYEGIFNKIYYDGGAKYEAESAIVKNTSLYYLCHASNSNLVKMSSKMKSLIDFNIKCGFAGDKMLYIKYSNGDKDAEQNLFVNGKQVAKLKYPYIGEWDRTFYIMLKVPIVLNKGDNSVVLKSEKNDVAIDYIEVAASEDYDKNSNISSVALEQEYQDSQEFCVILIANTKDSILLKYHLNEANLASCVLLDSDSDFKIKFKMNEVTIVDESGEILSKEII